MIHIPLHKYIKNAHTHRHVTHLKSGSAFDDVGPCVVLATPSMLQSGLSRELFEAWCEDRRNGVIIADFAVAGTLAKEILSEPSEITTRAGIRVCCDVRDDDDVMHVRHVHVIHTQICPYC